MSIGCASVTGWKKRVTKMSSDKHTSQMVTANNEGNDVNRIVIRVVAEYELDTFSCLGFNEDGTQVGICDMTDELMEAYVEASLDESALFAGETSRAIEIEIVRE